MWAHTLIHSSSHLSPLFYITMLLQPHLLLYHLCYSPPPTLSFPSLLYIFLISFILRPYPSLFLSLPLHVSSKIFASSLLIFNAESKHAKTFKPCGLGVQAYKTRLFSYIFHVVMHLSAMKLKECRFVSAAPAPESRSARRKKLILYTHRYNKHVFISLKFVIYYYMLDRTMMEISLCYHHLCIYHYDTLQHRES